MKKMRRNKGKVHPSLSSSSSSSSTLTPSPSPSPFPATGDSLSVLNLLPAAILSLAVVLSVEDREVLAYMITRSIKSTNPRCSKPGSNTHKSPVFECDCFDCYTSYWFRWDTSPNRELIHQVIEEFEDNLNNNEQVKKKAKKKEKITHRRFAGKPSELPVEYAGKTIELTEKYDVAAHRKVAGKPSQLPPDYDLLVGKTVELPEKYDVALMETEAEAVECAAEDGEVVTAAAEESPEKTAVVKTVMLSQQNRGLGRKVLPDVIGLLNWRLWNIWNPNV